MRRKLLLLLIICYTGLMAQTNFNSKEAKTTPRFKKSEMTGFTPKALWLLKHNKEQQVKFSQRVKNNKVPAGKAEIILEARDVWESGKIGYQMLLDADHNTYGDIFDASGGVYNGSDYDEFEYKIPADAEADEMTQKIIVDGEGKVEIPAGVYDYMITNPVPGDGVLIPDSEFSRFDNFKFEGGYTYRFRITLESTEFGVTDAVAVVVDIDASITDLTLPKTGMDLSASEAIHVKIMNKGVAAISNFPVSYEINGGKAVTETYTGTIQSGESVNYTFSRKADFSIEQVYIVKAYTSLKGDLIPYNDAVEKRCKHVGVASLPFTYGFSSAEDFESDWTVINADGDANSWEYDEYWEGPNGEMGVVTCSTYEGNVDDYLISSPIHLDKGANHITFYVKGVLADSEELLDVRYGKTPDGKKMEVIGDYAFMDDVFRLKAVNFTVAESGTYYFAFHAKSIKGTNIIMDDVTIDKGVFAVSPDIVIDKLLLPYSNCDLSDRTRIGVILSNKGTGPATSITLSYKVNTESPIMQTFSGSLPAGQSKEYYFDVPANLLDINTYDIEITSTCEGKTDTKTGTVENYAPVTEIPFIANFYLNEEIEDYWTQMSKNAWEYDSFGGWYAAKKMGEENGLLSRCFTLNHSFRVKIAYSGGFFGTPASFYIAYGKPGTDISTWKKIYEDSNILNDFEAEMSVELKTPGEYSFVIVNNTPDGITSPKLYQFTLSEILDYDLRVTDVNSPLSVYMPANHLKNDADYSVRIVNRGAKSMTGIKAHVYNGKDLLFSSGEGVMLESSAVDTLQIKGKLDQVVKGSKQDLKLEVKGNETDLYPVDNVWRFPSVHVTDSVFSTEQIKDFIYGTGLSGETGKFGNIYTLTEADTLTSVSVGLAENAYYTPADIGVAVYSLNANGVTIGRELFSTTFEREAKSGLREVSFVSRVLPAGRYFFEVRQLTPDNIGLAYEMVEESFFYQNVNDTLHLVSGFGNIVVRANFGHKAKPYKKNASAVEILKPVQSKALFTSEEVVTAVIENSGSEAITDMDVFCSVNGLEKSVKMSLAPYEKKTAEFTSIDLSIPGEYSIKVYTALKDDENKSDDAVTRILTSVPEASPYALDFESCNDFDTDHQFNPRWWTVDRLGLPVDSWWRFHYPNSEKPVGFMAFNIASTTPAMTDELNVPGFFAHSGERFGVAFVVTEGGIDSDSWLISPKLALSTNSSLELFVKTFALQSLDAKLERYNLLISDTDDNFDSFKKLGEERSAPTDWTRVTVDLNAYNNKEVYIAIQYVSKSLEGVVMMVDDINVKTDGIGVRNLSVNEDIKVWVNQNEKMLSAVAGESIIHVELYMVSGQKIYQSGYLNTCNFRLALGGYEPGVYVAHVKTATGTKIEKFILTR